MKKYITKSNLETQKLAEDFAKSFTGNVIALSGSLGTGKTTFTQGFAKGLGIKDKIISPTFVLIRQHKIPKTKKTLFHIDLYRLENQEEFKNLGLVDLFNNNNDIILVEWAEKAKNLLPKNTIWIHFNSIDLNTRQLSIEQPL
jgi:tRNA threonylcarbamoyladenosine biosynthesis protein TsaE